MRSKTKRSTRFGVCIDNAGYPASLEVGKLYPLIPDEQATQHGYIRVIDESGEDYGYSAERFFVLKAPEALAKALRPHFRATLRQPNRASQPTAQKRAAAERQAR